MSGMNPQALRLLMQAAEQGNPAAKKALQDQGKPTFEQSITPPPTDAQINVGPQPAPPQAQPIMPASPAPLSDNSVNAATAVPDSGIGRASSSGLTGMSPGQPTGGSIPSNFKKDLLAAGLGLVGAGVAKAFGGDAGKFMEGYAAPTVEGMQQRQQMENQRSQKVWADQWEQVQQLPAEVMNDPKFQELRDAAQAMAKDMEGGNVANPKTAANFMMARAKFKDDLEGIQQKLAIGREIEKTNLLSEAQHAQNLKKIQEAITTLNAPPGQVPEEAKQAAAAFLHDEKAPRPREVPDPRSGNMTTVYLTDEEFNAWGFKVQELKQAEQRINAGTAEQQERVRANKAGEALQGRQISQRGEELTYQREHDEALEAQEGTNQRKILQSLGVQYGKDAQGNPVIRLNGQIYPFNPTNPTANRETMRIIMSALQADARTRRTEQ
jgi:hypothetical protein